MADIEEPVNTVVAIKKRKPMGVISASSKKSKPQQTDDDLSFKASGSGVRSGPSDMGATATYQLDTELDRDAQAQLEKKLEASKKMRESGLDNIYRGQAAYAQFIEKKDSVSGNAASSKIKAGPIRAPSNIRVTARFDYQPDICKDYKLYGYCGYGDTCIYMHDRGDYKAGWQLDRDWDEQVKKGGNLEDFAQANRFVREDDNVKPEEDYPFACLICGKDFASPVMTKCKHYFCQKCALDHFRKNPKCFVCSAPTGGVFTPAKKLEALVRDKKNRMAARELELAAQDSDDGDDDGDRDDKKKHSLESVSTAKQ